MKNLVVYYSHDGNTRKAALLLAARLGSDLLDLRTAKPYPRFLLASFASRALEAMAGKRRALAGPDADLTGYGRVFIGTPTWMGHPAPAVREFLATHPMTGKQVGIFTTCAHMAQDCIAETELLLSGGTVVARQVFTGHDLAGRHASPASVVDRWVERLPVTAG